METQNNEQLKNLSYDLPYAIDVTLYKHNYYDRTLLGQLRRKTKYLQVPNNIDSFIVDIDDFRNLLNTEFAIELTKLNTISENEIPKNINSIYFINRIINNFNNLKYIKINVSDKRLYSRLSRNGAAYVINFDFKIITSIIDFSEYITTKSEYDILNKILKDVGLIQNDPFTKGKAYINTKSKSLMTLLEINELNYANENGEINPDVPEAEKFLEIFDLIFELVDTKVTQDDCKLVLITDYLN